MMRITVANRFFVKVLFISMVFQCIWDFKISKILVGIAEQLKIKISSTNLVDDNLISAIIAVESGGNPNAWNREKNARGLMQLTPIVYRTICGLDDNEAFDPIKNKACGTIYMKSLLTRFNGDIEQALSFYNSGDKNASKSYSRKVKKNLTGSPTL